MKPKQPNTAAQAPSGEKLQKLLAAAGLGSRRDMEKAIADGRVTLNGRLATVGDRAQPTDRITLDGRRVASAEAAKKPLQVLLYNKQEGEICSRSDPEGRPTVYERLPRLHCQRWIAVGRLDFNTSGLLLFTNNGDLANRLMHPSSGIDREYLVRVQGTVTESMRETLRNGVMLEDGMARFTDIVPAHERDEDEPVSSTNAWFYCVVMEGRNREVRRLWESQGVKVSRLKRVRYGNIFIPSHVRAGQWIELNEREMADLCQTAGIGIKDLTGNTVQKRRDHDNKRDRHLRKLRANAGKKRSH